MKSQQNDYILSQTLNTQLNYIDEFFIKTKIRRKILIKQKYLTSLIKKNMNANLIST